jgi:hypothetical protein
VLVAISPHLLSFRFGSAKSLVLPQRLASSLPECHGSPKIVSEVTYALCVSAENDLLGSCRPVWFSAEVP